MGAAKCKPSNSKVCKPIKIERPLPQLDKPKLIEIIKTEVSEPVSLNPTQTIKTNPTPITCDSEVAAAINAVQPGCSSQIEESTPQTNPVVKKSGAGARRECKSEKRKQPPDSDGAFNAKLMKRSMFVKQSDRSTSSYLRCVRYLVEKFKTSQEELQNKFHSQQLRLQQQQQEWEEKILNEEREYFGNILQSRDAFITKREETNDLNEHDAVA